MSIDSHVKFGILPAQSLYEIRTEIRGSIRL